MIWNSWVILNFHRWAHLLLGNWIKIFIGCNLSYYFIRNCDTSFEFLFKPYHCCWTFLSLLHWGSYHFHIDFHFHFLPILICLHLVPHSSTMFDNLFSYFVYSLYVTKNLLLKINSYFISICGELESASNM